MSEPQYIVGERKAVTRNHHKGKSAVSSSSELCEKGELCTMLITFTTLMAVFAYDGDCMS